MSDSIIRPCTEYIIIQKTVFQYFKNKNTKNSYFCESSTKLYKNAIKKSPQTLTFTGFLNVKNSFRYSVVSSAVSSFSSSHFT
ncbi:MAG: hypothetical protein IKN45_03230, partial [Lachnospiraceae bacterium]|nr:hypothetical protein [Lachnospiraceae bacterium]